MQHHDELRTMCADDLEVIAQATAVLPPGGKITSELLEYTKTIVGHCASIGDRYPHGGRSAGDEIRSRFARL